MEFPIKELFLLDPKVIFLNHGSFGACPRPVFAAYQTWQRLPANIPAAAEIGKAGYSRVAVLQAGVHAEARAAFSQIQESEIPASEYRIDSAEAYSTARYCLIDTLGCGLEALTYPACTKLMGPIVAGTIVRGANIMRLLYFFSVQTLS